MADKDKTTTTVTATVLPARSTTNLPPLPPPFNTSTTPLHLITQGAEAHLYRTTFLFTSTNTSTNTSTPQNSALKIRPPKPWRHPTLDRRLTRQRILAEARVLTKCRRDGVRVPGILGMSWEEGWVAMEWVEGGSVKDVVRSLSLQSGEGGKEKLSALLNRVGKAVGKLHAIGVVHGDLTTSNMIVEAESESDGPSEQLDADGEIVLIDFGLATQSVQDEDRAVDLYVLERAFGSTHPREEALFPIVLEAYGTSYKGARSALKRLEDVRMRGRKKSMVG